MKWRIFNIYKKSPLSDFVKTRSKIGMLCFPCPPLSIRWCLPPANEIRHSFRNKQLQREIDRRIRGIFMIRSARDLQRLVVLSRRENARRSLMTSWDEIARGTKLERGYSTGVNNKKCEVRAMFSEETRDIDRMGKCVRARCLEYLFIRIEMYDEFIYDTESWVLWKISLVRDNYW